MKTISRYIMTLALLLTAVTGAWAQSSLNVVELKVPADWEGVNNPMTAADLTGFYTSTKDEAKAWTGAPKTGSAVLFFAFDGEKASYVEFYNGDPLYDIKNPFQKTLVFGNSNSVKFFYTAEPTEWSLPPVTDKTNEWTFTMPGSDVVLTPQYAPAAKWDVVENVEQLPAALEGVIADTDAPLIVEGTVAFAGQSTTVKQGTVMYAVTPATETEAPALDAANKWSADVPTAKLVADGGADVYVWYYIKGADAPDGEEATAENTFNDSEICAEPIKVTVLSNKFDIQINAANANTIEAGKATVTVDDQSATVTEGKLQGVKMGSEVKLKAKEGYKFRKVEVKKKAAAPSLNITNPVVGQVIGSDGKNYAADATLPDGVTKVAMIAYVSGSNGLAIALADEGRLNWATAKSTCEAKTPAFTGSTWKLPSQEEWKQMFSANGGDEGSYTGLNTAITTAGGTALQGSRYWSSTELDEDNAYFVRLGNGSAGFSDDSKANDRLVRACLAF